MVEVEVAQQPEGFLLVRLAGEIDMSQAAAVRQAFALERPASVVLVQQGRATDGDDQGRAVAVVCTARGPVWRIVTLLGLDRRWPVHHDIARAAAALGRQR